MDDPDCDSTWEDDADDAGDEDAGDAGDEDAEEARPGALQLRTPGSRNWRAMQDLRRYRHHYPDLVGQECNDEDMPNLSFYKNEICFLPNGCLIEELLERWQSRYSLLEDNHSYIQWLFPLREPGVNWQAKPLTLREVEAFKSCPEAKERLVRAYELMLDFYGIQLQDRATGAVCRAHHYQKRFQNLNWRSHNNLRITRILKSLGELGLEHYQGPLVRFFLEETLVRRELPAVRQSALDYFVFAVRCPRQRRQLLRFAWEHFRPRNQFVWGPPEKLRRSRRPPTNALRQPEQPEPNRDGDREPSSPQEDDAEEGDSGRDKPDPKTGLGEEARVSGEDQPEPPSPKESKKRKLEASRQEQTPEEPGGQSACEVEAIVLNLEGCALSQGGQDPAEAGQPYPPPPGARLPEARKRRKVDQPGCLEAAEGRDGEEDGAGSVGLQQGAPGDPAVENGAVAGEVKTGSAKPGKL